MRENMAPTVLSKDDRPLSPWTHLTVEATHTRLPYNAIKLRLLGVLTTEVADLSLGIVRYETRLLWRDGATPLERERERRESFSICAFMLLNQFHVCRSIPHMCLMTLVVAALVRRRMHRRHCCLAEKEADCFPLGHTAPRPPGLACLGELSPSAAEHHVHCGMPGEKKHTYHCAGTYCSRIMYINKY